MSLVLYSTMLFYPGGGVADGASIPIHMHGSNQPPILFADSGATTPADNPITADSMGEFSFWAAPGHYLAELAGETFYIPIDPSHTAPVWQDIWVHTQVSAASTWTIDHHFGTNPSVDVIVSGAVVESEVAHPGPQTTVITFGSPMAGTAYLRR